MPPGAGVARVAVVGRGWLAHAVGTALVARGADVVPLGRADGVDATAPFSPAPHGRFDAVVEATDVATRSARLARAFFVASTRHVARCLGERTFTEHDVCGPGETTLWRVTRALSRRPAVTVPLPVPGASGRALRDGTLPPPGTGVIGPAFGQWVAQALR